MCRFKRKFSESVGILKDYFTWNFYENANIVFDDCTSKLSSKFDFSVKYFRTIQQN